MTPLEEIPDFFEWLKKQAFQSYLRRDKDEALNLLAVARAAKEPGTHLFEKHSKEK